MGQGDYDKQVLDEGGYIVELSNRGEKKKHNPNFFNPDKQHVKCVREGCEKLTRSMTCTCPNHGRLGDYPLHIRDWLGRIIPPGRKREDFLTWALPHYTISKLLVDWIGEDEERGLMVDSFIDEILKKLHSKIPDATTLQKSLEGKEKILITPDEFVRITNEILENHFPKNIFEKKTIDASEKKFHGTTLGKIPFRVVAATQILAFGCEEANRGDARGVTIHNIRPKYANMFMPLGVYLLMRKGATVAEARMAMK